MRWLFPVAPLGMWILALGVLGSACGGRDQLTAAQYFERTDMTLDGATERLRTLSGDYEDKMDSGEIDSVEGEVELMRERDAAFLSILRDVGHDINKLGPPAEIKSAHEGYAGALEGLIEAYEYVHSSDAYDEYLLALAKADIRERLEEAETAEEINDMLAEVRQIVPANPGIRTAHATLERACADLRDAAVVSKVGIQLPCDL